MPFQITNPQECQLLEISVSD